ncbi:MAG: SRPBCC family protein [Gammaproteobacteria bacterium]
MEHIEKTIEVNVPVSVAYNQWTQFEDFPEFMEGVEEVKQLSDTKLYWRADIGGMEKEWEATITDQVPDYRIAWHSTTGAPNTGVVTFHPIDDDTTQVLLELSYDPEGFVENTGDMLGLVERRVEGDLQRFKDFIESRGQETGAWRGRVRSGRVENPGDSYPQ